MSDAFVFTMIVLTVAGTRMVAVTELHLVHNPVHNRPLTLPGTGSRVAPSQWTKQHCSVMRMMDHQEDMMRMLPIMVGWVE